MIEVPMQPNMKNNHMTAEEAVKALEGMSSGALCSNGEDGFPYAAPVNFAVIDGMVYIHGRRLGEKVDNLRRDPRACFAAWREIGFEDTGPAGCDTTTVFESVIVKGEAEFIEDDDEKAKVLQAMVDKMAPGKEPMDMRKVPPTCVYRIVPTEVTGKFHRAMRGNSVRGA